MKSSRRQFLRRSGALGSASIAALGGVPLAMNAHSADTSGYRALVCLFFLGGLDSFDTVLPYDTGSYNEYARIRASLLNQYRFRNGGSTRVRNRLLPFAAGNRFGGREFAFTEDFRGIRDLYASGNAALVGNVGPLLQPVTRNQFLQDSRPLPKRLFSHNDQQSTWYSSQPEGAQFGWGGRFADAMLQAGANGGSSPFTTMTTLGNELFLTGRRSVPYQTDLDGAPTLLALNGFESSGNNAVQRARYDMLRAHYEARGFNPGSLIERDYANALRSAIGSNEAYGAALANGVSLNTPFPQSGLGGQLRAVANAIAARGALGVSRQIFFVGLGGFDTHSRQVQELPRLQQEIDSSVVAFFNAMQELGRGRDVTLFTASDFGRTLAINGDGTDHGWGAHHFVIGDAVRGGQVYGDLPPHTFGHSQDAGGGRLIPTLAVEQYAGALGRWFGLTNGELQAALPTLSNFPGPLPAIL